ncbi:MAG: hypothetical protein EXS08_16550 [Planctomycetes bacterium]|nr:hypothetical protein [Planctomycetota bacterium]
MSDLALSAHVLVRLERLERDNRRYKLAAAAAGLALFAWSACSLAPQAKNPLTSDRFVLVDAAGNEKAALELDAKGNPMLTLRNGPSTAVLTANGPSLLLRGPDGKTNAFLGIDSKNTSRLELASKRLLDGVRLTVHEDGSAGAYVLDLDGRPRGALEFLSSGGSALSLRDGQGHVRTQLGLDAHNQPNLVLLDEGGMRRMGMMVQQDGNPLLEVADDHGRPRAQLSTLFDGSPRLEMKREDGGSAFQAP